MRPLSRRNPHECAVAKVPAVVEVILQIGRNPHECAVAKISALMSVLWCNSRNPHECAVAKTPGTGVYEKVLASQPARMRCGKE